MILPQNGVSLPQNALILIKEYSRPLTNPDWKNGSYCNNAYKYSNLMIYLHNTTLCYSNYKKYQTHIDYYVINKHKSFTEDMNEYGETIFDCYSNLFYTSPKTENFYHYIKMNKLIKLKR